MIIKDIIPLVTAKPQGPSISLGPAQSVPVAIRFQHELARVEGTFTLRHPVRTELRVTHRQGCLAADPGQLVWEWAS